MKIFPAIDLKDGCAVRLYKGDFSNMTVFSDNPVAVAQSFKRSGAKNIHLVDLDGAREGKPVNSSVIEEIVRECGLFAEIGGGIRNAKRIDDYLSLGVGRIILGTAALENPDFLKGCVKDYGDKIAVGIDAKDGFVATRGWLEVTNVPSVDFAKKMRDTGVETIVYTDISRDGTLSGANTLIYEVLNKIEGLNVIASGGVSFIEDIKVLKNIGVYGAVLGKALYMKKLDLSEAVKIAEE